MRWLMIAFFVSTVVLLVAVGGATRHIRLQRLKNRSDAGTGDGSDVAGKRNTDSGSNSD